jgi:hypothetical protein
MVRTVPYRLILKLYWDNKRPASLDFTLGKRKKVHWDDIWQMGLVVNCLDAFIAAGTPGLRRRCGLGCCPWTETSPGTTVQDFLA